MSFSKELPTEITDYSSHNTHKLVENICDGHPIAGELRIDELYRSNRFNPHIHFGLTWRTADGPKSDNFCAIFHEFPLGIRNDYVSRTIFNGEPELRSRKLISCDEKQAMLIDYVKLVKNPNIGLIRNVVSLVRLTLLDFCEGGVADKFFESPCSFVETLFPPLVRQIGNAVFSAALTGVWFRTASW